jgi:TRAP-type mannitol/chloroaromatic compound transport system permease large subunit
MSWAGLRHAIEETTKVTVMLYWLFFGSSALIGVYTLAGGTKLIQDTMTSLPLEPIYIIIMFQIIWIILGCFIDLDRHPVLDGADLRAHRRESCGFDLVWLGVLFCLNMQISYISPPFGPAAFLSQRSDAARHHA